MVGGNTRGGRAEKSWREECWGDVRTADGETENRTSIYTCSLWRFRGSPGLEESKIVPCVIYFLLKISWISFSAGPLST